MPAGEFPYATRKLEQRAYVGINITFHLPPDFAMTIELEIQFQFHHSQEPAYEIQQILF